MGVEDFCFRKATAILDLTGPVRILQDPPILRHMSIWDLFHDFGFFFHSLPLLQTNPIQLVIRLQVHPELSTRSENGFQANRDIRSHRYVPVQNVAEVLRRDIQPCREFFLAHPQKLHTLLDGLTGVNSDLRLEPFHSAISPMRPSGPRAASSSSPDPDSTG